jgi:hypothetical protein
MSGLVGLMFGLFAASAFSAGNFAGGLRLALLLIVAALACVGILRRRRFGVWAFIATYGFIILAPMLIDAMDGQEPKPSEGAQNGMMLIFLVVTSVYFKRRYRFMQPTRPLEPLPAPPMGGGS